MPAFTDEEVRSHHLTIYRKAHNDARASLQAELDEQTKISTKSADDAEAAAAAAAALELTNKLGLFEAEHDRFLVTVVIKTIRHGPGEQVVRETQALANELVQAIKAKNSAALTLQTITKYLSGAIAVFNGTVPAAPAAAPAPAD